MGLEFINRILKTTTNYALIITVATCFYSDWKWGLGFLIGVTWSLINLFFLKGLIIQVVSPDKPKKAATVILGLLKFPVLYYLGYLAITSDYFTIYSLLIGFSFLFVVVLLKVLGRLIMGLEIADFTGKSVEGTR